MIERMLPGLFALLCARAPDGEVPPADPIAFGRAVLAQAGVDLARVETRIDPARGREAYRYAGGPQGVRVTAGDATGAMYALLELAERARAHGAGSLGDARGEGTPFLADRGLNLFLTLPFDDASGTTDYDPAALADPQRWWFHDDGYWRTLLDQMAQSRLNWLDLHGTWDIHSTGAPNLYAYLVDAPGFPEVGIDSELKRANLARLNRVIELAHARGVRVSVMSYEARLRTPHRPDPPHPDDEATAYDYTRAAVEALIRGAPGLDAIGFRIGESGRGGGFFRCYVEAVDRSGRDVPLLTRSWVTRKQQVVPLARAASDFTVEIKYDGEQWAAPYPFCGGRVADWHSYSFEDYLSDSRWQEPGAAPGAPAPAAKRLWPGHALADGARWPDQPYKIVWQVRANGTHRIFPFHQPDWVRRSIEPMRIGTANGFTIEPLNAYFPASPRYYVADPAQLPCDWIHQRDELYLLEWGRLGYDPGTPDRVFEQRLHELYGKAAGPLDAAWRAASKVVPLALLARAYGPDHRDHAPELEWGGPPREWLEGEGLDTHAFLPIREEIALRATGGRDGRISVRRVAGELDALSATIARELPRIEAAARDVPPAGAARLVELRHALAQLGSLARYHAARQRGAWWSALAEGFAPAGAREQAAAEHERALAAWRELSESPAAQWYRPFTDRLRMRTHRFHWRDQLPAVEAACRAPGGERPGDARAAPPRLPDAAAPPAGIALRWQQVERDVVASLPAHGIERAWLLHKPLPSSTFFHRVAMEKAGERFVARLPRERCGHLLAAEIAAGDGQWRIPDALHETPWLVVPSQPGETPLVFATGEALAHLDPAALDPERHGPLIVAPRAWQFFRDFAPAQQRKLLDAVARGMRLVILQQDYVSGRYPLSWLPQPPQAIESRRSSFEPGDALGLEVISAQDIVWQRFAPSPGWKLHGDGAVASTRHGKGEIWLVQARLIQNLHVPAAARALLQLLRLGGGKPAVLVDPGTENNRYGSSVIPDFMNAHGLAFLTLGELIAQEQGVAAAAVVPARPWDDLLLGGKGGEQLRRFQEQAARAAAARPAPATREELEAWQPQQRQAIRAALGLDPLPPRTPLEARVTGVVQRDGYRVEKVVFHSRPGFPVTAHAYVPDGAGPFPLLLNPHGHWRHKKLEPVVQQRLIQQALAGYLALIVDSPGFSFEGDTPVERRYAGSHHDFRIAAASCGAGAVYVWDLMRALDYAQTRPDVDFERIGITGASGGGHATLWTFAADERIDAAVPVVFATSLEDMPHNGCACNHVPGTTRLGDRADVLAARAPAPVLVLGARDDREFPPAGTERTGRKLAERWALLDAADRVGAKVFDGPHDYNLAMVAEALAFFDRHLKGDEEARPGELAARDTAAPLDPELLCLPVPPAGLRTLRDLAAERLAAAAKQPRTRDPAAFVAHAGGIPAGGPRGVQVQDARGAAVEFPRDEAAAEALANATLYLTFESEPGLRVPAVLRLPRKAPRAVAVLLVDGGKTLAPARCNVEKLLLGGFACLALDARGFGELADLDLRLAIYADQAPAFAAAIDLERAVQLVRPLAPKVVVVGDGPVASFAALSLALAAPGAADAIVAREGLRDWSELLDESVPLLALQPQADLLPPLADLRAAVRAPSHFTFRGDPGFDLFAALLRLLRW